MPGGIADEVLAPYDDCWAEAADAALQRRFGSGTAASRAEQARRARFLQQRGFPAGTVWRLIGDRAGSDD